MTATTAMTLVLAMLLFASPSTAETLPPAVQAAITQASAAISKFCGAQCPNATLAPSCLGACLQRSTNNLLQCIQGCALLSGSTCDGLSINGVAVSFSCTAPANTPAGNTTDAPFPEPTGICGFSGNPQAYVPAILGAMAIVAFFAWWYSTRPHQRHMPLPTDFLASQCGIKATVKILLYGFLTSQFVLVLLLGAGEHSLLSAAEHGTTILKMIGYLCLVPIAFWPVFVAADTMDTLVGAALGCVSMGLWFLLHSLNFFCIHPAFLTIGVFHRIYYALFWIESVALLAIFVWATICAYRGDGIRRFLPLCDEASADAFVRAHHAAHVTQLLSRQRTTLEPNLYAHRPRGLPGSSKARDYELERGNPKASGILPSWRATLQDIAYTLWGGGGSTRACRLVSFRMMAVLWMSIHTLFCFLVTGWASAQSVLGVFYSFILAKLTLSCKLIHPGSDFEVSILGFFTLYTTVSFTGNSYVQLLYNSNVLALWFTSIGLSLMCFQMLVAHGARRNRLAAGDYSFLPRDCSGLSTGFAVIFPGCQLAFVYVGATLIETLIFSGIFFTGLAVESSEFRHQAWRYFKETLHYLIPIWVAIGWKLLARYFVNCVFTTDRRFAVRFPIPFFHLFEYLSFIINTVVGFASYVFRIAVTIIILLVVFVRCDKCVMPRGFEEFDLGYVSYISALMLEALHCNPVAMAFKELLVAKRCSPVQPGRPASRQVNDETGDKYALLLDPLEAPDQALDDQQSCINPMGLPLRSRRARNRWALAYTLIFNPTLRSYRRTAATPQD